MSNLGYYVSLLEDQRRIAFFARAIEAVVRPGDHVVEVGSGLGTYALLAARAGARIVSAIDRDPVAMALAREIGVERISGGRVRLIEAPAEQVTLDEPADVVIFEDFGSFIVRPGLRRVFRHVKERLARPGARWVPPEIEVVLAPEDYPLRTLDPARPGALPFPSDSIAILRKRALNDPTMVDFKPEWMVAPGVAAGSVRMSGDLPARLTFAAATRAARDAEIRGLTAWMRVHGAPGEVLDNSPAEPRPSWRVQILPFEEPVRVARGESIDLWLEAVHGPGPDAVLLRWGARTPAGARESSSTNALPGDLPTLLRGSPEHVPVAVPSSATVSRILAEVDGSNTVAEIARRVYASPGSAVPDAEAAQALVLDVLERLRGVAAR